MTTRDFVSTTFCVNNNKVLLVFHKKLNKWLPPGGHVDENELPCDAAIREFKEETGLDISLRGKEEKLGDIKKLIQPKHIQLEDFDNGHQHIDFIYFATLMNSEQKVNIEAEKIKELKWFSEEDLDGDEIIEDVRITSKIALGELK